MGKAKLRKLLKSKISKGLEKSKTFQSKLKGIEKQMKLHTDKIREAFDRNDEGAINYMAREITDYFKIKEKLTKKLLPKKKK